MAVIRDFAITEYGTATTASMDCEMPNHEANDILIYFASKDGTPVIAATAGWNAIQDGTTAGCAYRCMWKLATSNAETLTLTTATAENWTVVVVSIKNANTSSPISASAESAADDTAMPFDGPSTDTGTDTNCLILHAWFSDSGLSPTAYPPLVNLFAGDNGANSASVAYTYQRSAGAVAAASWYGRANDDGRGVVVAVKDNGSETEIPPYNDSTISSGNVLRPLVGLSTTFSDSWPTSLSLGAIGDDWDQAWTYIASVYTDKTTDLNNATASDVTLGTAVGDILYLGYSAKFDVALLQVATAGVAGVLAWEYWNGSTWSASGMPANNLTATGWQRLAFTKPTDWATTTVNGSSSLYYIRGRVTTLYTTAVVLTQGRAKGAATTFDTVAASADAGTNPYTDAARITPLSSTTNLGGAQVNFGSALDMGTGIIMGTFRALLPRDLAVDPAFAPTSKIQGETGGIVVVFRDANSNYKSYIIHSKRALSTDVDGRNVYAIDWNGSAVAWASNGTINKSAVTNMLFLGRTYQGQTDIDFSMLVLITRIGIAGGTAANPLTFLQLENVINKCCGIFPYFRRSGSAATIYAPLQFGGNDPVYISVDLKTFQFPRQYDGIDYFDWNVGPNVAGIKFYPKIRSFAGDTYCKSYNANTSTYTNEGTDINDADANDVALPPIQDTTTGDAIYFGHTRTFNTLRLNIGTAAVRSGYTLQWQYYNGSWTALSNVIDNTNGFQTSGTNNVSWTMPSDWANTTVDSQAAYWVRCVVTVKGTTTTSPLATQGWIDADMIKFTNCVFTSESSYRFEFDSSSANIGAAFDMSGTVVVNAQVTLKPVATFSTMSFINCSQIAASDCTLSGCTISGAPAAGDGITVSSSTLLTSCSIDTTSISAGNSFVSTATPNNISDCTFTGSSSSGHAIRITSPGTYSFVGNTFTDYGANGTTSAAIYNDSGGLVTLNISGGGDTPTYRNGTGASTNIVLSVSVSLTVLDESNNPIAGAQVYFQKSATGKQWNYSSDAGNNAGDADFVVNEAVDLDIPQTGWLHVWNKSSNGKQNYRYTSWSSKTFTLPTEITGTADAGGSSTTLIDAGGNFTTINLQEGDTIRNTTDGSWAIVDEIVSSSQLTTTSLQGGSDNTWQNGDTWSLHRLALSYTDNDDLVDIPIFNGQTDSNGQISTSYNYSAYSTNLPVTIRVRSNEGEPQYIPYTTSGTITSSGYAGTVVLTEDTVAQ